MMQLRVVKPLALARSLSLSSLFQVKLKQVLLQMWVRQALFLCVGVVIGGAIVRIYQDPSSRAWFKGEYWSELNRVGEAIRLIEARYYDRNVSRFNQLADRAISGLVQSMDRHSAYYAPKQYDHFNNSMNMRYYGIGIKIRATSEGALVTHVFKDAPAESAGLMVGDRITKVGDYSVIGLNTTEVGNMIRGNAGSGVLLTMVNVLGKICEAEVIRGSIEMPSVEEAWVDENGTGYLRISQFSRSTEEEVDSVLHAMQAEGMRRVVLDLRDNGGGLLDSAVAVAGFFLPSDKPIVKVIGRTPHETREIKSPRTEPPLEQPMTVLINEGSASGSELLAGALAKLGRASTVGETSFGKGSVQTVFPLADGAGIRLTTSTYCLPDGTNLHQKGLAPIFLVPCSEEEESKLRLQRDVGKELDDHTYEELFGFPRIPDHQLSAAIEVLFHAGSRNGSTQ